MTSLSQIIKIYERRKEAAEKKCQNIAARLRMSKNDDLKELFKDYKETLKINQHLIETSKAKLKRHKADDEPIKQIEAFLRIMIGYTKHGNTEKRKFEYLLELVTEGDYGSAARNIKYLQCEPFQEKMDETTMYFYSKPWFQTKYYYYQILLNRA